MQARIVTFMPSGACLRNSKGTPGPGARLLGSCPNRYSKSSAVIAPRRVSPAVEGTRGTPSGQNGRSAYSAVSTAQCRKPEQVTHHHFTVRPAWSSDVTGTRHWPPQLTQRALVALASVASSDSQAQSLSVTPCTIRFCLISSARSPPCSARVRIRPRSAGLMPETQIAPSTMSTWDHSAPRFCWKAAKDLPSPVT